MWWWGDFVASPVDFVSYKTEYSMFTLKIILKLNTM